MKNTIWAAMGIIAVACASNTVPKISQRAVSDDACADISGTYKAMGSTDWVGPLKNHTATIFYVLRRKAPPSASSFNVTTASGKLLFAAIGADSEPDRIEIGVTCIGGHWTSHYNFSNYSDGATSRVDGEDTFSVDGSGALVIVSRIAGATTAILTRHFDATTTTSFAKISPD